MAAGWIPKPTMGKKAVGPCAPDCHRWTVKNTPERLIAAGESHRDCQQLREQATSSCRLCSKPIGFDTRMYVDPVNDQALVHGICLEDAVR